jgi:uncharacterized protein (DUF1499 family)
LYDEDHQSSTAKKAGLCCSGCLEITFFIFLIIIVLTRANAANKASNPQIDLKSFPSQCADWSEAEGCSRIVQYSSNCIRPEDIPKTYDTVFANTNITDFIESCFLESMRATKIIYKSQDSTYLHGVTSSVIFGFLDDVFIQSSPLTANSVFVSAQSQLRIGQGDFNKNYEHLDAFYKCLNEKAAKSKDVSVTKPCQESQKKAN